MKKNKEKISVKNIAKGIIIGVLVVIILLFIDDSLAYNLYYKDMNTLWSPDGKHLVFVRYYPMIDGRYAPFEIWKMKPDGSGKTLLYESQDDYNYFGLQSLLFSDDGNYLNLVEKFQDNDRGIYKEKAVRIPVDSAKKSESAQWELDKKNQYDTILAFQNNKVIYRKIHENNPECAWELLEMDFDTKEVLNNNKFSSQDIICSSLDYYGDEVIGAVSKMNNTKEKNLSFMYDFNKNHIAKNELNIFQLLYLPQKKKTILVIEYEDKAKALVEVNNQSEIIDQYQLQLSPEATDERFRQIIIDKNGENVIFIDGNDLHGVNLATKGQKLIAKDLSENKIGLVAISPDEKKITFTNGDTIFLYDIETKKISSLTQLSPHSKMLKKPWFRKYIAIREELIFGGHSH